MAISSNYYTNARITSLYSGMDTDTLITNSLYAEQNKLDKIFQKKERAEWQLEAYAEISNMVSDLRTNFLSVLGDNSVMKNATYNKYAASITENSAISVSANETALPTSLSILSAVKATAASVSAAAKNASRASVSGSNTLTVPDTVTADQAAAAIGIQRACCESCVKIDVLAAEQMLLDFIGHFHAAHVGCDDLECGEAGTDLSEHLGGAVYGIRRIRIAAGVKCNGEPKLGGGFINGKHCRLIDEKALIVRVKLYAFETELLYAVQFLDGIFRCRENTAERIEIAVLAGCCKVIHRGHL